MRASLLLVAFALLLWGQNALVSTLPRQERSTSVGARMELAGPLFGGLKPLMLSRLWWKLETDLSDQLYGEVLATLSLLRTLEPVDSRAAAYLSRFLVWDLAPREESGLRRLAHLEEGMLVLRQTEELRRERGFPEDPALLFQRVTILVRPELWDAGMVASYRARWTRTPLEEAVALVEGAAKEGKASVAMKYLQSFAHRMRGAELWFRDGNPKAALRQFESAVRALPEADQGGPLGRLIAEIHAWGEAMERGGGADLLGPMERASDLISKHEYASEDLALVAALLHVSVERLLTMTRSGDVAVALSVLRLVHSIQGLLQRIQGENPSRRLSVTNHRPDLLSAAKRILERDPSTRERIPRDLLP